MCAKDGKTAKARWRTMEMKGEHGKSGAWGEGIYENEYALEDGVWKISKLHYYLTFRADYDKGWSKGTLPIEKASDTLPPDAPPTEVFGSLPEVYLPPYHYANLGSKSEPRPDPGHAPADLASLAKKIEPAERRDRSAEPAARVRLLRRQESCGTKSPSCSRTNATLEIGGRGVFVGKKRVQRVHALPGQAGAAARLAVRSLAVAAHHARGGRRQNCESASARVRHGRHAGHWRSGAGVRGVGRVHV